jgi:hypothetical protein
MRTAISLSLGGLPTCTTAPLVGSPMDIPLGIKPVYPVEPPIVPIAVQHDATSTLIRTPRPGVLDDTVAVRLMSLRIRHLRVRGTPNGLPPCVHASRLHMHAYICHDVARYPLRAAVCVRVGMEPVGAEARRTWDAEVVSVAQQGLVSRRAQGLPHGLWLDDGPRVRHGHPLTEITVCCVSCVSSIAV